MANPDYSGYKDLVFERFGVDYAVMEETYLQFATSVGIYADVGLLLFTLVTHPDISLVVEFGAGMSTCALAKACQQGGANFTSIESSSVWVTRVGQALDSLGLPGVDIVDTSLSGQLPDLPRGIDLLWVDGHLLQVEDKLQGRVDACRHYQHLLEDTLLAFDDAQWFSDSIESWLSSSELHKGRETVWFNPTGRADRQVLLSVPANKSHMSSMIRSLV